VNTDGTDSNQGTGATCDEYCAEHGLQCKEAWLSDDGQNACEQSLADCGDRFLGSHFLCDCIPKRRRLSSVELECQEIFSNSHHVCQWEDGDHCLVNTDGTDSNQGTGATCDEYCAEHGLQCKEAWLSDDGQNACEQSLADCGDRFLGSHYLCDCIPKRRHLSSIELNCLEIFRQAYHVCQWEDGDYCLVNTDGTDSNQGTGANCNEYCAEHGLQCKEAWLSDDGRNACQQSLVDCEDRFQGSHYLCNCIP